jgi:pyruvate/2-oxoacid:ferredoxin oxidoreductase beta subunit
MVTIKGYQVCACERCKGCDGRTAIRLIYRMLGDSDSLTKMKRRDVCVCVWGGGKEGGPGLRVGGRKESHA